MMEYLVLLYGDEAGSPTPGTPEWDDDMAGFDAFGELAGEHIVGGEALESATNTITIRTGDGGGPAVTNGPFAETTEVLGGFFVLDAPSLDDAIELARQIPTASHEQSNGAIEIRPLVTWFDRSADLPEAPGTPRFLVTIHGEETDAEEPGSDDWEAGAAEHAAFAEDAATHLLTGGAVHPSHTATTIRVRDGELLLTDGPFAEASEIVGGLYVIRAGSVDEAVEVAGRVPLPPDGGVEVRPIMELDG
jgi:hypothetical protein